MLLHQPSNGSAFALVSHSTGKCGQLLATLLAMLVCAPSCGCRATRDPFSELRYTVPREPGPYSVGPSTGTGGAWRAPAPAYPNRTTPAAPQLRPQPKLLEFEPIEQTGGQTTGNPSTILGRVVDVFGRPQAGVSVVAVQSRRPGTQRIEALTDVQGGFRFTRLEPGRRYLILATATHTREAMIGRVAAVPPDHRVVIEIARPFTVNRGATTSANGARVARSPAPPAVEPPRRDRQDLIGENQRESPWDMPAPPKRTVPDPARNAVPSRTLRRAPESETPSSMSAPHIARTPIEQPERIASRGPRDTQSPDAPRRAGQEFPAQPRSEDVREFRSGERRAGSSARRLDAIEPREPLTQAADTDQALRLDRQDTTPARARVELQPPELQKPSPGPVRRPRTAFHGPSCEFDRDVLVDFALPDLDLQEVTFQDINSRLVLIDFWGTWCGPCLRAIPHLVEMQRRYGPQGLQVVGIAYEHEESVPERVARVQQAREQLRINYPVLLGEMATGCPVKEKFGVHMYPTLVLLDKSGRILWKCEGVTAPKLQQLENLLKTQLANQSIGYK